MRAASDGPLFLVVRSSKHREHWVLPKGHIEAGEALGQTAVREVREEAGVIAEIVEYLGASEYTTPDERCAVAFFAMRFLGTAPAAEDRAVDWLTADDAVARLSFEDAKRWVERVASS